ncbi:streptophobe family protein [Streptomyces sp. NPDC059740]|uniref:streptophobe family protein n=1 Tax=Streptomyces sp. NPDC059740 TaxID=3346926 RepID=UPI0036579CEF
MSSTSPRPAPPGSPWRHALEGAFAVGAAVTAMAAAAWAALALLGAGAIAPLSRLVPLLVSAAAGGDVTVESDPSSGAGADGGGGLFGGAGGGGMTLGLRGHLAVTPLALTFLGAAVLALLFFRPLRRRQRPTPGMLWARCAGALGATSVILPALAAMAQGTARLPGSLTDRFTGGAGAGALGRLGMGGGGGLSKGLSSALFRSDPGTTLFLGLLGVGAVLAIGCLAARRTTLPQPVALGRPRLKWNAVTSTLVGTAAVLCCAAFAVALLAGAAALTGRAQAAQAAGLLLLAGPNLIAVLCTAGLGTSWEAGLHRLQAEGGGMAGMLGGAQGGAGGAHGKDRSLDLSGWSGAGVPLWLACMLVAVLLLVAAGYVAAARTPARTPREETDAVLGRHVETALRLGTAVAATVLLLPLLARGSLRFGITFMGSEMGGLAAGLDGAPGFSAVIGFALAVLAGYGGSRLRERRARRSGPAPRQSDGARRRGDGARPGQAAAERSAPPSPSASSPAPSPSRSSRGMSDSSPETV